MNNFWTEIGIGCVDGSINRLFAYTLSLAVVVTNLLFPTSPEMSYIINTITLAFFITHVIGRVINRSNQIGGGSE